MFIVDIEEKKKKNMKENKSIKRRTFIQRNNCHLLISKNKI